jgi:hypothetical protein
MFFMPIRAYLDGHAFDAETIRQIGIAFEMGFDAMPRRCATRLDGRGF